MNDASVRWWGAAAEGDARERLVPVVLAVLATAVVVASIGPYPVGVFQDDGIYTVLAKSLATGQGYRYLHIPDAPNATHYPPLYPLLLAGIWKLFPSFPANVTIFKFVNAALIGVTAVLAWRFARRGVGMGPWVAALSVAAFAAGTPMVFLGVMALSEPMFVAALFPVLMLGERASRSGSLRDAALAGAGAGLLAMIRTIGAVALPAMALVLVWRRRWAAACIVCLCGGLVMLPWQWWIAVHESGIPSILTGKYGSYGGWLIEGFQTGGGWRWIGRLMEFNLRLVVGQGWEVFAVLQAASPVQWAATAAATAFFGAGWWLLLRRAPVAAWFVALYLLVVIAWPFAPSRFIYAIWPLIGIQVGLGIEALLRWRPTPRAFAALRYAGVVAALGLALGYARYNYLGYAYGWWVQDQASVAERTRYLAEWTRRNTADDAILATEDDLILYLYTGRRAVPVGTSTPHDIFQTQKPAFMSDALRTILRTFDVDYVLVSTDLGGFAARGLVQATPPELRFVVALKQGAVFQPTARAGAAGGSR